jgi:UDP-glucose 4-epimerase
VTIFDQNESPYLKPGQEMILGDILDEGAIQKAVLGKEIVYNLAGYADLDSASLKPITTAKLNVIGNLNIIEAAVNNNISQYIYASTIYVFSESGGFYRCSKQSSEIYIEEYNKKFGLNFTILRYGTLYGPRADQRNSIYRYLASALNQNKIEVKGTGEEIREYIHVRDAAKVSAKILSPEYYNKRFIITGHQAIPVKQMVQMIQEILKKSIEIKYQDSDDSDHYKITPYSFVPKIGEKFAPELFTDMGQGLIECLADMHSKNS